MSAPSLRDPCLGVSATCALAIAVCALARPLAAEPRGKAPLATKPAALPGGVTLAPFVKLPDTPAFKARAPGWWKRAQPCPKGAKPVREKLDARLHVVVCRNGKGKQHGPAIALFAGDKPYEDSWAERDVNHGTRWTWREDGSIDHVESWVDGKLQGPAEEWSGGKQIAAGAYLDDKKHGEWTSATRPA